MKIAVIGSRTIKRIDCREIGAKPGDWIVSGGAKGVDTLAEDFATANGFPVLRFLPDYHRYGKAAPHVRNGQIVAAADRVVAFWDGKSRGTKSTIEKAKRYGKEVHIVMC